MLAQQKRGQFVRFFMDNLSLILTSLCPYQSRLGFSLELPRVAKSFINATLVGKLKSLFLLSSKVDSLCTVLWTIFPCHYYSMV